MEGEWMFGRKARNNLAIKRSRRTITREAGARIRPGRAAAVNTTWRDAFIAGTLTTIAYLISSGFVGPKYPRVRWPFLSGAFLRNAARVEIDVVDDHLATPASFQRNGKLPSVNSFRNLGVTLLGRE